MASLDYDEENTGEGRGLINPLAPCGGGEHFVGGVRRAQANCSRESGDFQQWTIAIRSEDEEGDTGEDRGFTNLTVPRGGGEHFAEEVQRTQTEECTRESRIYIKVKASKESTGMSEEDLIVARKGVCPELVESVMKTASSMFSSEDDLCEEGLINLIVEAIASTDGNYGIQEAIKWANGYEFPQHLVDSDLRLFRASQLDFNKMVKRRLTKLGDNRLSRLRVSRLREDNPELERLLDIAQGMRVPLPIGFLPNAKGSLTPLRPVYVEVHQAVDKMLADLHGQGLAFCLPKKDAIALIDGLHLGKASWTPKKGKASGRSIGDMSFCDGTPLNCDESKAIAEEWWGKIELPTIEDVVVMILEFYDSERQRDPFVKWEDLRLWKTDLRGAYQLMSLRPECAKYFGMEISKERVFIHLCGIFGWTCTPAAFQVVSRGIQWELKHRLKGRCKMYVDDIVGVCMAADLYDEIQCAKTVCVDLLGPNAIAEDKTESGTRLDVLGYVLDLGLRLVSISRKNFLNAVYCFFTTELGKKTSLATAQKLASWGSRYSKICRAMRPFCGALHRATAGRKNPHAKFLLPEEARRAIRGWRAMLYLVSFDEQQYSRRMGSFQPEQSRYVIEFDASLSGAGILWYQRLADGSEFAIGGSAVDLRGFRFGFDSSFQNTAEYIGCTLGLIGLALLGIRDVDVEVRGDSVAALTWAETERPRGELVTNASIVFTLLVIHFGLDVKKSVHISGEDNWRCDRLSRLSESGLGVAQSLAGMGLGDTVIIELQQRCQVQKLLASCDPGICLDGDDAFLAFWGGIRDALKEITREVTNLAVVPHSLVKPQV